MFAENFSRLIGMHGLHAKEAARLLGVSAQTISGWMGSKRRPQSGGSHPSQPSTRVVLAISDFFEVPAEKLFSDSFADLLEIVTDRERYERVESKIRRAGLKAVS